MLRVYGYFKTALIWLVLAVIAALVGDYFIKFGERHHLYEATNDILAAAMSWVDALTAQSWFWPSFLFLAALALGMRLSRPCCQDKKSPKNVLWRLRHNTGLLLPAFVTIHRSKLNALQLR